ncbi:MAG: type I DNA topoisomerase [Anaerolineae bacterium]
MTAGPKAYCLRCAAHRDIEGAESVQTKTGRPALRGRCPVCGGGLFRLQPGSKSPPASGEARRRKGTGRKARPERDGRLVIVESPAKASTLGRYLDSKYRVVASVGHVRDLLRSRLAVDVEDDFAPTYRIPNEKRPIVKELRKAAAGASEVYLATDPDREGEAIAWHLVEALELHELPVHRVVFHEITPDAVAEAFAHPQEIDRRLVDAQQARRILDRLVGFQVSPLLWRKIQNRLSAGRVQSVALRLVVEREREIEAFDPEEYWTLEAELAKLTGEAFRAQLYRKDDEEVSLAGADEAQKVVRALEPCRYRVERVRRTVRRRRSPPPFITSTLQQEASWRLGYAPRRTMQLAQSLYEGVELGEEGTVGLITYMRTDSVRISKAAQEEARRYVREEFGDRFVPPDPPHHKSRARRAQEAHEAVRPTSVLRSPKAIGRHLSRAQRRLYDLIWRRFLASQMTAAQRELTRADIVATRPHAGGDRGSEPATYWLRARGSTLLFPGFLKVMPDRDNAKREQQLPPLEKDEALELVRLLPEQHFTKPPRRYSEAALIRTLEEEGIGRPSTYAPIVGTLQNRYYVERRDRTLRPTELGTAVNDLVVAHFPDVFEVGFTARMEEELDRIASGELNWVDVVRDFHEPFSADLVRAEAEMKEVDLDQPTGELCPESGHPLVLKFGRFGRFVACSNFPECRYTRSYAEKIGVRCPEDGGELVARRTRKGRRFYGCANYPECEFASWKRPLPAPCPSCGGMLVAEAGEKASCVSCGTHFRLEDLKEPARAET